MPFSNCPGLTIGRRIQVGAPQTWFKVEEEPDVEKGESYSLKSQFHWIVLDFSSTATPYQQSQSETKDWVAIAFTKRDDSTAPIEVVQLSSLIGWNRVSLSFQKKAGMVNGRKKKEEKKKRVKKKVL